MIGVSDFASGRVYVNQLSESIKFKLDARVPEKKSYCASKGVEKMSSEQVKENLMKHMKPNVNVRVKAIRKTRNDVMIEIASEKERKALCESKRYENVGLTGQLPRKTGPKIERVRIVNRDGKKSATLGNIAMEVNKSVCDKLVYEGRVYIEWSAFKVKVYESSDTICVMDMGI